MQRRPDTKMNLVLSWYVIQRDGVRCTGTHTAKLKRNGHRSRSQAMRLLVRRLVRAHNSLGDSQWKEIGVSWGDTP